VTLGAQVDSYLGELAPIAGFAPGSAADATVAVYCVDALPPAAPGADTARGDARFADYASCNTQEDKSAADCEEATPTDRRWGRLPAAPPRCDATAAPGADGAAGAIHAGVVDVFARDEAAPVGRWYSHPAAGACEPGAAPGDAGCAWRHGATARVVRGAQLYQLGLNASGLTCDLGDYLAPDGDTGRLRQVSPDRDPWVADCAPLAAQVRQNAAVLRAAVAAAPLAPWTCGSDSEGADPGGPADRDTAAGELSRVARPGGDGAAGVERA